MNTVKSFWLGWGSLCVAGGGAYYFAKQQINADRQAKMDAHRKKRQMIHNLEVEQDGGAPRDDHAFSPSTEIAQDPAPTRHAPATEDQRINEKSKYESSSVYRSPKGDRFS